MKINLDDLGILCVYAIQCSMGMYNYIPEKIRGIVRPLLPVLLDRHIKMLGMSCRAQASAQKWGGEEQEWKEWAKEVNAEWKRRKIS